MSTTVKVKKVKAYPFAAQFQVGTTTFQGQIVRVTEKGFLAEVSFGNIKPGEKLNCSFEIPVLHHSVSEGCILIKLYNQWNGATHAKHGDAADPNAKSGGAGNGAAAAVNGPAGAYAKVVHLAEFHFTNINATNRNKIASFVRATHGETDC